MCAVTVCLFVFVLSLSCVIPPSFSRYIAASRRFCDAGQFLDVQRDTCRNCTTSCPQNQIIRRTCSLVADSVCGPFFEFRPQNEDAEKNDEEYTLRRFQMEQKKRRQKGTNGTMRTGASDAAFGNRLSCLTPSPPAAEGDGEGMHCWRSVGCIGILTAASMLCVVVVGMVVLLLLRWRFIRGRKLLSRSVTGAESGRLRTRYHVLVPRVVSPSLSGPVDKRVMHLELQLRRNWVRRADAGGTPSSASIQLIDGNDYVNEKMRSASIWNASTAI